MGPKESPEIDSTASGKLLYEKASLTNLRGDDFFLISGLEIIGQPYEKSQPWNSHHTLG